MDRLEAKKEIARIIDVIEKAQRALNEVYLHSDVSIYFPLEEAMSELRELSQTKINELSKIAELESITL